VPVTPLAELLDRLRRPRQPPGRAAATVGVPATELDIAAELAPLFGRLDQIGAEAAAIVERGRAEAATIELDGQGEVQRILGQAARAAELAADRLQGERHEAAEDEARAILAGARADAERLRDGATKQVATVVDDVLALLVRGAG
jgi:vacuolar-type H+-ATPase subunit H